MRTDVYHRDLQVHRWPPRHGMSVMFMAPHRSQYGLWLDASLESHPYPWIEFVIQTARHCWLLGESLILNPPGAQSCGTPRGHAP